MAAQHEAFESGWDFNTKAASGVNFVTGLEPPNGFRVAPPLVLSGLTRPGSRVQIVATGSSTVAQFSENAESSFATAVGADGRGYFEAQLDVVDTGSGIVDVRIQSTAPNGSVAVKTLRLRM